MTLLLLHGPAINNSRKKLVEIKEKFDASSIVSFEEGTDLQTILGSLVTPVLFSDEQLIILENPPEDFVLPTTRFAARRADYRLPTTVILWFDHEVSEKKPVMEWVRNNKGQVFYFPESREVSVFPFLDYLASGDKKAFLEIEKLKKGGFDIHYVLTMVFYLLRNLVATPTNAPDFVRKKLVRQRTRFNLQRITGLYEDILEIDFKIKSGFLEKSQAEFLLVSKFLGH